jgi:protein involved in polysaccharide export with SLBB domain
VGEEVFWSSDPPSLLPGCSHLPSNEEPGSISVREVCGDGPDPNRKCSFDELWSVAVFELYNIANSEESARLNLQVVDGRLSRDEFATKRFLMELKASEKARSFYVHVFLPLAKQCRIATNPCQWYLPEEPYSQESSAQIWRDRNRTNWREYERWYDAIVEYAKTHKRDAQNRFRGIVDFAAARRDSSRGRSPAVAEPSETMKRIEPLDVLSVWVTGELTDHPIQRRCQVEPDGDLSLGPAYARVKVKGLTLAEAEAAIKKHLERVLKTPDVEVLAAGRATEWPGSTPKLPYHIRPSVLLRIKAIGTPSDHQIDGDFLVDERGKVQFEEMYGSVTVEGLTLEEAERAIRKQLRGILLRPEADQAIGKALSGLRIDAEVSVTLAGWKRGIKGPS